MEEICDQTRGQTVANVEQILQELRALNPDAQIILVGYYNPLPFLPTYGKHFRLLNRSVKALAQQYGADYVSIPYTSIANDGHPTVCGHKYIARQILKPSASKRFVFSRPCLSGGVFLLSYVYFRHFSFKKLLF